MSKKKALELKFLRECTKNGKLTMEQNIVSPGDIPLFGKGRRKKVTRMLNTRAINMQRKNDKLRISELKLYEQMSQGLTQDQRRELQRLKSRVYE